MFSQAVNEGSLTYNQTSLGRSEKLVATKRNYINSDVDKLAHNRFVVYPILPQIAELARACVFVKRKSCFMSKQRELEKFRSTRKSNDAIVGGMNAHDQARVCINSAFVVFQMSTVGGANFDHASAGTRHNIGHTKVAADLYEFSSRNDRLAVSGQNCEDQQGGRGAVVYNQSIFSTT